MTILNQCVCGHYPWGHSKDGCPACDCKIPGPWGEKKPDPARPNPNCWGRGPDNVAACDCLAIFLRTKTKKEGAAV